MEMTTEMIRVMLKKLLEDTRQDGWDILSIRKVNDLIEMNGTPLNNQYFIVLSDGFSTAYFHYNFQDQLLFKTRSNGSLNTAYWSAEINYNLTLTELTGRLHRHMDYNTYYW
tara:strand:- start:589 stop:924 length:336 start_codon:yes stop_codon:yes gene_type:complete